MSFQMQKQLYPLSTHNEMLELCTGTDTKSAQNLPWNIDSLYT